MNLTTQQNKHVNRKNSIQEILSGSIVEELSIYNQAYLQLDTPLINISVIHEKTKYELPLMFTIDGDFSGNIICLIDIYNKNLTAENKTLFVSLYSESMNILLGKMMTNLDFESGHNVLISNPKMPSDEMIKNCVAKNFNQETLSMCYKYISNALEYDCRIIFNVNKNKLTEV